MSDFLHVAVACPVDEQGRLVVLFCQMAGCIAGELEDGGTAHAPMGDEQRALAAEGGGRDVDDGIVHHQALQGGEGRVGDGEGEKGGTDPLPDILPRPLSRGGRGESCGMCAVGGHAACGDGDEVEVLEEGGRLFYLGAELDVDVVPSCFTEEAVDDGVAVLRFGENTLIFLNREGHSMCLEPLEGIGRAELLEEAFEQVCSTGVNLLQVGHVGKGVGAVATSPTRNFHLCQHFPLPLEDGHVKFGHQFLHVDGQEETCGTTADDSDLLPRPLSRRGRGEIMRGVCIWGTCRMVLLPLYGGGWEGVSILLVQVLH